MQIHLNGEPRTLEDVQTLAELLDQLDLEVRRLAVAVNREVVPRGEFGELRLREGDQVEIIHAVAGG